MRFYRISTTNKKRIKNPTTLTNVNIRQHIIKQS